MKLINFFAASLILFTASACGSEIERDADKMAESAIELNQLYQRKNDRSNLHGKPVSRLEILRFEQQHAELFNEMSKKYGGSREQWKEFQQLVDKKIKESE